MHQPLRFLWLLITGAFFMVAQVSVGQVTLNNSGNYTETFDGIGTGYPTGWTSYTGATATSLGNAVVLTTATTSWNNTAGAFKNFASGDIGASGTQASATDRALGLRQTGAFGDPGAAFALQLANTTGYQAFNLTFKLQSLDATAVGRQTTWRVDYGFGASPTVYTAIATTPTPLTTTYGTFANQTVTVNFSNVLDNQPGPVWIRIVALAATTGSGTRASTGIDDFTLTYSTVSATAPSLFANPATLTGFFTLQGTPSAVKSYTLTGSNLGAGNVVATAPTGYELAVSGTTSFASTLSLPTTSGTISQPVDVRLSGAGAGTVSGTITHTTGTTAVASVSVSGLVDTGGGQVGPCGTSQSILSARQLGTGQVVTISGRLTVSGQFANGRNYYLQDAGGGIAIFDSPDNRGIDYALGDFIQVTGTTDAFNSDKQLKTITCFGRIGTDNVPVTPTPIAAADLCNYQGQLVSISNVSFAAAAGTTFVGSTNYALTGLPGQVRIYNTTNLVSSLRPTGTTSITGVVGVFNSTCQIFPRFISDVDGAVANSGAVCGVPTITPDPNALDVIIWNVEWLGNPANGPSQSGAGDATQIANVTTVLKNLNADVFMLEEVCQYNAANPTDNSTAFGQLINGLNSQYGAGTYAGECSPAVSGSVPDANPQRVCIIYKSALVTKVASRPLLTGATVTGYPTGNPSQFYASGRLPFMFTGQVTINSDSKTVRFIGIHAKSGSDQTSYNRRVYDTKALYDTLVAQYPNDLIIYAGDINDDVDKSIYLTDPTNNVAAISSYKPFLYTDPNETNINGTRPNANFVAITKALSDAGCASTVSYPDIIDHIIVSNEMAPAYVANSVTRITPNISNYGNTTTDHYPIYAKFNLASALPVQLVDFRATVVGDQVSLGWETAMEKDAAQFVVERSADLNEFGAIGQLKPVGNSTTRQTYTLVDKAPRPGTNYYRLRTVDQDGTSQLSKVVAATIDDVTPVMTVTGNPITDGKIRLAVRNMAGATYQLRTITGQTIRTTVTNQNDRLVELQLGQPVSAGLYLLEGTIGTAQQVVKILAD
ncbi:hypothetical protein J2I47_21510 [Fibrella sp. HMF5335]|uniref:Por secretion system C-terminal sorting domain-containing protein n=1 Tax=Fibrella rubiginis TaxID=2817060 RepID=A0A939GHA2_9BACT|nr:DUF5689 domain-containing protein [Fibrella rubiginis]MBO0939147.1 hypothetical protein [Fibrella rubiginis]